MVGSRGSALARIQTEQVCARLRAAHRSTSVCVHPIVTRGDRILDRPISAVGDSALFVEAIWDALRSGEVDCAVHSAKDVPLVRPFDIAIAAVTQRIDARDALVSPFGGLDALPFGARVGTCSARRTAQLRAVRQDLVFRDIRGNVDSRLRKLERGEYDALVLAMAGLERLGCIDERVMPLDPGLMLPAPGQGALIVETRADDDQLVEMLQCLNHPPSAIAVRAERAFLAATSGDCHSPVAAHAVVSGVDVAITGCIASFSGASVRASRVSRVSQHVASARALADHMLSHGGAELLRARRTLGGAIAS